MLAGNRPEGRREFAASRQGHAVVDGLGRNPHSPQIRHKDAPCICARIAARRRAKQSAQDDAYREQRARVSGRWNKGVRHGVLSTLAKGHTERTRDTVTRSHGDMAHVTCRYMHASALIPFCEAHAPPDYPYVKCPSDLYRKPLAPAGICQSAPL